MTRLPDTVGSLEEAAEAMYICVQLCVLLANQGPRVSDTYAVRAALVQHLFTHVLPLPLPETHPARARDFWTSARVRRAVQAEMLQSLRLLTQHYATAAFALHSTPSFDAARLITFGCLAAVLDAVLRLRTLDPPAPFVAHYNGLAGGPARPFGFDVGPFAAETEFLLLPTPALVTARTQVISACAVDC